MKHRWICGAAFACTMVFAGSICASAATEKLTPAKNAGDAAEVTLTVTLSWEEGGKEAESRPEEGIEVTVTRKISDAKTVNQAESLEIEALDAGNRYQIEEKVAVFDSDGEAYEYSVSVEDDAVEGYTISAESALNRNGDMTVSLTAVPEDSGTVAVEKPEFAERFDGFSAVQILAIGLACGAAVALVIAGILTAGGGRKGKQAETVSPQTEKENGLRTVAKHTEIHQTVPVMPDADGSSVGRVHNIGRRRNQQDTFGAASTRLGFLAVVSDGMGGLSNGEKVSQQAVKGMLQAAEQVRAAGGDNPLYEMLSLCNSQVLKLLGPDQIYKSGATLLAVLTNGSRFHWIAVGDSRIYLYCDHHLIQINREHIYKQKLLHMAVNQKATFDRVKADPQRDRLVSFLGMGDLEYIDGSLRPMDLRHGDKLLMMSDGVFNTISERMIIKILESTVNADEAAKLMEKQVLAAQNPKQDNFTCLILDF